MNRAVTLNDSSNLIIGLKYSVGNNGEGFTAIFTDYDETTGDCEFLGKIIRPQQTIMRYIVNKNLIESVKNVGAREELKLCETFSKYGNPKFYSRLNQKLQEVQI